MRERGNSANYGERLERSALEAPAGEIPASGLDVVTAEGMVPLGVTCSLWRSTWGVESASALAPVDYGSWERDDLRFASGRLSLASLGRSTAKSPHVKI